MGRQDSGSDSSRELTGQGSVTGSAERSGMGLIPSTALVMGSVVGTGVFMLPAAFAPFGLIALAGFALAAVGATALALTFGALARRIPAQGGPYAYALAAFGPFAGFSAAWFYWITAWVSRAGMVVGWITYVQVFVNRDGDRGLSIAIGLLGLWVPALINLSGIRNIAAVQVVTTFLKFIPLVAISTIGLFFVDWAGLRPFNLSGSSPLSAMVACMALAVFAYLGVETASVAAGRVRNPRRNVPLASLLGTLACSVVYLLSTLVIMGTVSNAALSKANAQPFVLSFDAILGGTWSGYAVAVAAIISGFGACTGWTMVCAEMSKAAADQGLFPKRFAVQSTAGVPAFGIVVSTLLSTLLLAVSYFGQAGVGVFEVVILLAGLSAAVPYLLSALALMKWSGDRGARSATANWRLDGAIATVAAAFSVLIVYGALAAPGTRAKLLVFAAAAWVIGIVIYLSMRRAAR
ncbi:MAG: amino acid permease [Thermoanaerobaculaceae bacterium]|jgi:APA family basic amino acid/polyamine antiporter|nr:amino acid permease [Thermoanaerobaculaceae bacterium]